jgi:purine-nucleoside phosphorylase
VPAASDDVTARLRARLAGRSAKWALVCGSGIGEGLIAKGALGIRIEEDVPLGALGLPVPHVEGHGNAVVLGSVAGSRVLVQTGRLHPYEGHDPSICTAALAAMIACGAKTVVLTCAVGSLRDRLRPGDLCVLRDQINLWGPTPLLGPRFVDCSQLYAPSLRARLQEIARRRKEPLEEAVYAYARGPQYESPAEVEALRTMGADVVGMSTTYEAILAAASGATTCAVAVVTNYAGAVGSSHEDVQARSEAALSRLGGLLAELFADRDHG